MNGKNLLILSSYLLMLFLLCGCVTIPGGSAQGKDLDVSSSVGVATVLRFDDVPAPSGFKVLAQESFAFQNDVTRVALLKYVGGRRADEVVLFYKEQMPLYNWSPINIIEYERRILNFEKENESCIVTIESKGMKRFITIAISPKSRPMKAESRK